VQGVWGEFLPTLHPVDVRPASLLWRREFFSRLGGFDGRFESGEDFQLVLKADRLGARIARPAMPKQIYRVRPGNSNWDRLHVEGHLRVFEWLKNQTKNSAEFSAITRWIGQGTLYQIVVALRLGFRRMRAIWGFVWWRIKGRS
jgi:GT2 family glycosyltransferase